MAREHHYSAHLVWTGAAQGPTKDYASYSRDYVVRMEGKPDLVGSSDPLFRGDPKRHNPEDWLLAALSACHMLTFLAMCGRKNISVLSYEDAASGTMVLEGGGGGLPVRHEAETRVSPSPGTGEGGERKRAG